MNKQSAGTVLVQFFLENYILLILLLGLLLLLFIDPKVLTKKKRNTMIGVDALGFAISIAMYILPWGTFLEAMILGFARGAVIFCIIYLLYAYKFSLIRLREEQEQRLKEQRDALMVSQIQPHFMYNTLNVIYYLCNTNPKLAKNTIHKFSDYLQNNLDMSSKPDQLIPFAQELQHTKLYADIEMLRFDHIKVIYEIQTDRFMVPSLCVQPIVENAIRHGVRDVESGIVKVRTYENDNEYVITVKDNGIGYVVDDQLGQHSHIGIANVRDRIESMTGGTFSIEMERNVGTTVTMTIPKGEREWEN